MPITNSQAALSGGQSLGEGGLLLGGNFCLGGGGGGGKSQVSHPPLYETLIKDAKLLVMVFVQHEIS